VKRQDAGHLAVE